jgi:hypothetical protein
LLPLISAHVTVGAVTSCSGRSSMVERGLPKVKGKDVQIKKLPQ